MKYLVKAEGHFYAVSAIEWNVRENPETLVKLMKSSGWDFTLYWVPHPIDTEYRIENYVPQIQGVIRLAHFAKKEPKK